jgi:hypothetical protein
MGLPLQHFVDYFRVPSSVWAVESMGLPLQHFVDYFWVPRAVWAVESMGLPLQHFVDYFWVPRAVWAVEYMGFRYSTSLIIYESLGLFGLSNPWVTRYRTSLIISE